MPLFRIPIKDDWEKLYSILCGAELVEDSLVLGFTNNILEYMDIILSLADKYPIFEGLDLHGEITFRDLFNYNVWHIEEEFREKNTPQNIMKELSELIFWVSLDLPELHLLLNNSDVNEVYINGEKSPIYINHLELGHIPTNLTVSRKGLNALTRILEMIYGEGVIELGGNIEVEIEIYGEKFRVVLDTYPLTHGDYNVVIRRLRNRYFNIDMLVEIGFMNVFQKDIIKEVASKAGSILIVGEPNSGKTTLLNAILKIIPNRLRKIYFEEARELEDLRDIGNHQVFYRFSGVTKEEFRAGQTIFTLRRSPEYVVIGEVISDEDIDILLNTLLLGYRLSATIHATDIDSLWERFRKAYGENFIVAVRNIDLLIFTKRDILSNRRYVESLYRVSSDGRPIEIRADNLRKRRE